MKFGRAGERAQRRWSERRGPHRGSRLHALERMVSACSARNEQQGCDGGRLGVDHALRELALRMHHICMTPKMKLLRLRIWQQLVAQRPIKSLSTVQHSARGWLKL